MSAVGLAGTFADMLEVAQPGDYMFLWDKTPISYVIEELTQRVIDGHEEDGPSHVVNLCDFPAFSDEMYEMEAVFVFGCRMLPLSHYAKKANRMLLCRREDATESDIVRAVGVGLGCLGRQYEVKEEFEIALREIAPWVHVAKTDNKLFCSGLTEHMWSHTGVPFAPAKNGGNLTPMECMIDAKTQPVMWVN